jgi:hypothetical protein
MPRFIVDDHDSQHTENRYGYGDGQRAAHFAARTAAILHMSSLHFARLTWRLLSFSKLRARPKVPLLHASPPLFQVIVGRNNSLRGWLQGLLIQEEKMVAEEREKASLIGSDKVEGTAVYGPDDAKIGSIERVMIDKKSGRVSYAVLSFGGFLGIGDDHYPLPWQSLKYDTNLGGYRTGITETQLKGAPKYSNDNTWNWSDPARARAVNDYYGVLVP